MLSGRAIVCYCPAVAIDVTMSLRGFQPGRVSRADAEIVRPGGKGFVAARTAVALGNDASVICFLAGFSGRLFASLASMEAVQVIPIWVEGEVRTDVAIYDAKSGLTTVFNSPPKLSVSPAAIAECDAAILGAVIPKGVLVIGGSVPESVPAGHIRGLIEQCHTARVCCIVDSTHRGIDAALEANADVLRLNLDEALNFLDSRPRRDIESGAADLIETAARAGATLTEMGARSCLIGLGSKGCVAVTSEGTFHLITRAALGVAKFGAGDSFVGALAGHLASDPDLLNAARFATAVAAASLNAPVAGDVDPTVVASYLEDVRVISMC